jgi:hypothetical protein
VNGLFAEKGGKKKECNTALILSKKNRITQAIQGEKKYLKTDIKGLQRCV